MINQISVTTPFFGVAFFVGNWLFLGAILISLVVAILKPKQTAVRLVDEDDEDDI